MNPQYTVLSITDFNNHMFCDYTLPHCHVVQIISIPLTQVTKGLQFQLSMYCTYKYERSLIEFMYFVKHSCRVLYVFSIQCPSFQPILLLQNICLPLSSHDQWIVTKNISKFVQSSSHTFVSYIITSIKTYYFILSALYL